MLWQKTLNKIKKFEYLLLAVILLLGFGVRLYRIGNPIADWHSWRQADTASVSRIYMEEGVNVLYPRYYDISRIQTGILNLQGLRFVEFPVYNVIHVALAKNISFCPKVPYPPMARPKWLNFFFPPNLDFNSIGVPCFEVWGRLISIFSSLISAVFLYKIAKKFYGRYTALLTAFLFLLVPYNIYFSRVILPEPLSVTFVLGAMWFFIVYLEKEKLLPLLASGILFALSTLLKPFTFFYGIPLFYLAIKKFGVKGMFKNIKLLIFADIAIIPFFLWRIWVNQYPAGIPHFTWAFNGDRIRFQPAYWYWVFGERIGKLILGVWGVVPFSFGLLKKGKNLFSQFFLLGVLLYVSIVATANVRHDYYQIYLVPPLVLLVAIGATSARSRAEKLLMTASIALMLVIGGVQAKEYYNVNHPEIIHAGIAADKIIPKDARVIAPYNGDTAFLYQIRRYGLPVVDDNFETLIKKTGVKYFVTVNYTDPDTKFVEEHYKVLQKTPEFLIADLTEKIK